MNREVTKVLVLVLEKPTLVAARKINLRTTGRQTSFLSVPIA